MSGQYNGDPQNVLDNLFAPVSILSSTNANPIVIQTSAPHNLTTLDSVDVTGHFPNYSANGVNVATVVDPTHFSIPVAGVAVGGNNGTATPLSFGPTYSIPTDGDNLDASSVGVPLEALGDRTSALALSTGAWKIVQVGTLLIGAPTATPVAWGSFASTSTPTDTWFPLTTSHVFQIFFTRPGDIVSVRLSTTGYLGGLTVGNMSLGLISATALPGSGAGSYTFVPGSSKLLYFTGVPIPVPFVFSGISLDANLSGVSNGQVIDIQIGAFVHNTSAPTDPVTINAYGEALFEFTVYRNTGIQQ